MTNPYKNLPDNRFWRRSVSRVKQFEVDPISSPKIKLLKSIKSQQQAVASRNTLQGICTSLASIITLQNKHTLYLMMH